VRVNQAFRFELSPNAAQRRALAQHIGAARFAYNWGLSLCQKALEEGRKPRRLASSLPPSPERRTAFT
jgi:putative transposase